MRHCLADQLIAYDCRSREDNCLVSFHVDLMVH